jgi:hypothetical protein
MPSSDALSGIARYARREKHIVLLREDVDDIWIKKSGRALLPLAANSGAYRNKALIGFGLS